MFPLNTKTSTFLCPGVWVFPAQPRSTCLGYATSEDSGVQGLGFPGLKLHCSRAHSPLLLPRLSELDYALKAESSPEGLQGSTD